MLHLNLNFRQLLGITVTFVFLSLNAYALDTVNCPKDLNISWEGITTSHYDTRADVMYGDSVAFYSVSYEALKSIESLQLKVTLNQDRSSEEFCYYYARSGDYQMYVKIYDPAHYRRHTFPLRDSIAMEMSVYKDLNNPQTTIETALFQTNVKVHTLSREKVVTDTSAEIRYPVLCEGCYLYYPMMGHADKITVEVAK